MRRQICAPNANLGILDRTNHSCRRSRTRLCVSLCIAAAMGMQVSVVRGQMIEETQDEPAWLEAGPIDNPSDEEQVVVLGIVTASGGPWARVHVGNYELGSASYLTFTALDGHIQRHDARSLPDWSFWSAKFNGSDVEVALHVAPGDFGVFAQIDQVKSPRADHSNMPAEVVAGTGICNDFDDRGASGDARIGRLPGCTGWLVSNGAVLTAGHCSGIMLNSIMEFNVPPSLPNGITFASAPNDQYPVTAILGSENGGHGADWMVLRIGPNTIGQQAHHVQGFFRMTKLTPNADTTIRVTGYGIDNTPAGPGGSFCMNGGNHGLSCTSNANCPGGTCRGPHCCDPDGAGTDFGCQFNCSAASATQQSTIGRMDDLEDDIIEFDVDIMPGTSGGPIIWEQTLGYAFGIATHNGCEDFFLEFNNHGTHLHRGALEAALQNFLGPNTKYVDAVDAGLPSNGSIYEPLHSVASAVVAVADDGIIALVPGFYPRAAGNTFVAGLDRKAMTFTAPAGAAVIGN